MTVTTDSALRVTVTIERREDGGLYVYSDDLPGFVLSHADPDRVLADIEPALNVFMSQFVNHDVQVKPLVDLRDALVANGIVDELPKGRTTRDYVGLAA
ncbi:hypothetical protein GCM10008026_07280 [Chelatococcus composti]|nr:hypothetical protein GCM10008026_07280 [Chelatococcus composti]